MIRFMPFKNCVFGVIGSALWGRHTCRQLRHPVHPCIRQSRCHRKRSAHRKCGRHRKKGVGKWMSCCAGETGQLHIFSYWL